MDFAYARHWSTGLAMKPSTKVQAILNLDGWTQERLAEALGVAQSSVNRWFNAKSEPRGHFRDAISELYNQLYNGDGSVDKSVKLAGFVGAAQTVYQFDDDGAGYVEAPPGANNMTEAVEVRGDSMLPLYETGTLLYYSRQLPPELMVGKRAIVRLEDERVLVKTIRRGSGPGLYTLASMNAPDIEDVGVQWAAPIDWIKPS